MANTKKDVLERYQSYKVSDYDKVDRNLDRADEYSEIIKKFDEIDELSTQISTGTVSALESYYENISAFDKDLRKVVSVAKEKMEKKGVSAESLKKLDKVSGVYEDTKEKIDEVSKIKRLADKNLKELTAAQERQKEIRDKIKDIKSKDPKDVDQKEYFALKEEQANLEVTIDEKQKKKSNYSERLKDISEDFSISKEAENFESKILESFKDLAKDSEVSDNVMDLFKGFFAYNNGKYEITYPGWDKVKDAVNAIEDLKEKQKRVDDLSSELGIDSPSRDAITKTNEEEVKEVETPEETREVGSIDESEKDETTKDEPDKDDPSKDESEKDEPEKDEPEKDEPINDKTVENKDPAQKAKVQQPMTYAERTKQFAKKVGPVTVATAKNLDQKSYHGDAMPEFKGVEQTDPMYRNNVYMNPEEKQEFYEQMGYINSPESKPVAGVNDEDLKENAKDSFVRTLYQRYRTEPYLAGQMFDILYAKNIIDLDFNSKALNKKEKDELISQIATELEKDPAVIAQLLAQSLSVTKRDNVARRAYKVISTRVATASELFKARTKGVRSFIDNIFGYEEMQNQYSQDASGRGR